MKQFLRKLIVGLMTFVIGVNAYSFYQRYSLTSLCDIEKNPQRYAGKEMRLRAVFDRNKYYISAISCCNTEISAASIELAPSEIADFPLPINDYSKEKSSERVYLMDAVLVGQMDKYISLGCFAPKYHIKNVRVERVISIREFENSDKALEWLKSNSY